MFRYKFLLHSLHASRVKEYLDLYSTVLNLRTVLYRSVSVHADLQIVDGISSARRAFVREESDGMESKQVVCSIETTSV